MTLASGRVLLHLAGRIRRVVDADDVYSLEAQGDETDVRLGGEKPLRDVRSLGEVLPVSRRSLNGLLAAYRGVKGARARRATGPGRS
jgi:hypothetical protein